MPAATDVRKTAEGIKQIREAVLLLSVCMGKTKPLEVRPRLKLAGAIAHLVSDTKKVAAPQS